MMDAGPQALSRSALRIASAAVRLAASNLQWLVMSL